MRAKTKKTVPEVKNRGGFHAVSWGMQASTARLSVLGDLKGPKQAREWLILSLAEMGQELGKYTGKVYHKSIISNWDRGYRKVPFEVVQAYAELIANKLSALLGRRIEISIEVNSPWHVSAYARCACNQLFKMHDAKSKHCPKCSRRG